MRIMADANVIVSAILFPILANAIESKVDLLITGDKDFDDVLI